MQMVLAGTGPATGFPVPRCWCAACARAGSGSDGGPVQGRWPARRPAELRLGAEALDVEGVVHGPGRSWQQPRDGEQLELAGVAVRAVGGTRLLHDRDRPAEQVLWAPQAGRLSDAVLEALAGVRLAAVFLGPDPDLDPADPCDSGDPAAERPPLLECALGLARLRAIGAVTELTRCLLVGLGHRQGHPARLATCLAHWGARTPVDGTRITLGPDAEPGPPPPAPGGRTLVLGGSASGKSALAEQLLSARPDVVYTATGPVVDLRSHPDAEWAQRVRRHQERRPSWWRTEETHEVAALLAKLDQPVLLDSVGTWLTGVLDRAGAWHDRAGWRDRLSADTDALVRAWRARRAPLVAVTDEVGWSVVPATASGRLFRDELGRLNRRLADESERVLVVVAGRLLTDVPTGLAP